MRHRKYCQHCGATEVPLMKGSVNRKYNIRYYRCRPCNKKNVEKYTRTPAGKAAQKRAIEKTTQKYPEKRDARLKVNYAVKTGKLKKPGLCEICGADGRIEGHHMDYEKPLDVIWLCTSCHADYHTLV